MLQATAEWCTEKSASSDYSVRLAEAVEAVEKLIESTNKGEI